MTRLASRQRLPILAGLAALALGLAQPAFAAPEAASPLKPFRVEDFERVILPKDAESYVGRTLHLKTKPSEGVNIALGYKFIALNDAPIHAAVGGLQYDVPIGSIFTKRDATGGRLSELPPNTLILCQEALQRNLSQSLASAVTLGLTQLAARYAENVQLCGVDADRDGKMEMLFLGGAKEQQDLEFTKVEPIPYEYKENFQVEGITFVLYAFKQLWGTPILVAGVERGAGARSDFSALWLEKDGKMIPAPAIVSIKKKALPQEVKFGSAVFTVTHFDESTGVIDLEFSKFFDTQKIRWYVAPQTIYIYY